MSININGDMIYIGRGGVEWQAGLPTLMMMHGAGMDHTVWVLLGRYFARHGYNVVLTDLPGHGNSSGAPLPSIEANAEWVWHVLDELAKDAPLDLHKVSLCGHSMGSLVMLHAASLRASQTERLLLLGGGYPMPVGQPLLDAAEANDHTAIDMICHYSHAFGSVIGNNPVAGISVYNAAEILLERAKAGVLFTDLSACNNYQGGEQAMAAVKSQMDIAVIAGAADRMTPLPRNESASMHHQMGADLTLLADCGHMMMAEQPEATLQAMKRCLS